MKYKNKKYIVFPFVFGVIYWILESILDYFYSGTATLDNNLFSTISDYHFYARTTVILCIFIFGVILSKVLKKYEVAEQELREQKQRYTLATETGKVSVWDYNIKTKDLYLDPNLKSSLGYADHEIQNNLDAWMKLVHPEDHQKIQKDIREHIDGKISKFETIHRMVHKNGSTRRFFVRGQALHDDNGQPYRLIGTDTDITQYHIMAQKLRASEEKFRALTEHSQDIIMRFDRQHRHLYVNSAISILFDLEPKDFIGKTHEELGFSADMCHYWKQNLQKVFDTGLPVEEEFEIEGKNGPIVFDWRLVPEFNANNIVETVMTTARDITLRKKAEKKLKERNKYIQTILDNLPIGLAVYRINDKKVAYLNNKFEDICGWPHNSFLTRDDFYNKVFQDVHYRKKVRDRIVADLNNPDSANLKWGNITIRTKTGKKKIITISNIPLLEQNLMISTIRNVTKKRKIENALKDSEQKFRTIAEQSFDIIFAFDVDGNLSFVSSSAERVLSYSVDELIVHNVLDYAIKHSSQKITHSFNDIINGNTVENLEVPLVTNKGIVVSMDVNASPLYRNGKIVGALAIARDVTDRRRTEKQLKQSLLEKEVLLKEIHHRVKNNLQVITSLINLQSNLIHDKQALNAFKETKVRVKSMALVHEKLYQSNDYTQIDFNDYIHSLVGNLFQIYAITGNISLEVNAQNTSFNINKAVPCGLLINELLSNAIKHAFPNGQQGKITINLHLINNKFELIVKDNGVGLPEHIDIKNNDSLGLQLVSILTEQLEGQIELSRKTGTTFKIQFDNF